MRRRRLRRRRHNLRAFTFGHVRQLEAEIGKTLEPSWGFGAGPGAEPLVIDIDSTICEVDGNLKHGAEPEPRGSEPERFGLSDELGAFVIAVAYVQSELGRLLRE